LEPSVGADEARETLVIFLCNRHVFGRSRSLEGDRTTMPELSRFLGIRIAMQYNDHAPPHFHVRYGEHRATYALSPLRPFEGRLPPRVVGLVMEWAALHERELMDDWHLARKGVPLQRIAPLE
jgi:hypothetical protein